MANKLIDELIIKVKQQGAKPTEKAIRSVAEALKDAKESSTVFNSALETMPKYLQRVEKAALRTAKNLNKVKLNFSSAAAEKSLGSIEASLNALVEETVDVNHTMTMMNNNMVRSFENLANSLGADLERVEDSLIDVNKQARRTGNALEGVGKGAIKAGRGMGNQNRQGRNSARTFSDIAKVAGPLPLLYANIAANAFALSEAFRLLSEGEQLNRLEQVGTIVGARIGVPVQSTAKSMQELTGYTLSYGESIRQAAAAASYGFDTEQIEQLTMAARRASIALGVDMQDAMNRVIRGTSKLEIELLDELGITTKLTTAYENYAKNLGISATALNAYQQRAALVAEINAQSVEKFGDLDAMLRDGAPWEKFGANVATAFQEMGKSVAEGTSVIAEFFNSIDEKSRRIKAPLETAENLIASFSQAGATNGRAGLVGVMIETERQVQILESRLVELGKVEPVHKFGTQWVQWKDEVTNTNTAIKRLNDTILSADLGVPNVQKADAAYKSLNISIKGSKPSYETSLANIRGQSAGYEKLYSDISSVSQAYYDIKKADPSADLAETLRKLGFQSEAALNSALKLASSYRDASKDLAILNQVAAEGALRERIAGRDPEESKFLSLKAQLNIQQRLAESQAALGAGEAKMAKIYTDIANTKNKILDTSIAIVDTNISERNTQTELTRAGEPELLIKKEILANEQRRLNALRNIKGSQQEQEVSLNRIKQLQNEITAMQLSESMSLMNSALSDLAGYGTGIDQLTGSLNSLALSFNNMGESSLNATQMTSMGLQAFQGMLQYTSANAVSAVDAQIAAERKRDGKSKESIAKIRELEAKKIKMQQDAAKKQILISTAVAVMNAAANPWPVPAIPLMAAAALAGGLAYSQASSAASNQLSSLGGEGSSKAASLTVGSRDNRVDVSSQATRGELSYIRGEQGVGSVGSFTPRAAGGVGTPGLSFIAGENGPELVTPTEQVQVTDAEDTANMLRGGRSGALIENMNIQAMDAQSIIDRAPEIYEAFSREASQRGQDVNRLG